MPILSALYIHDGEQTEITPQQIQVHLYETKYKGNLFCSTEGCNAKIVYVHKATSSSYFRTWKYENHNDSCLHKFDREKGKIGERVAQIFNVEASTTKKSKALEEAFRMARQDESARVLTSSIRKTKKSPATTGQTESIQAQLVLFDGIDELTISRQGIRMPRILKRDSKILRDSDVGKVRLVFGAITSVKHEPTRAQFHIDGGNKIIHVRFEEAFFASNPTFAGLFHHAQRLCSEMENVIFTGIGEVKVGANGDYELHMYRGEDFKLQNTTLHSLATYYSSGLADAN